MRGYCELCKCCLFHKQTEGIGGLILCGDCYPIVLDRLDKISDILLLPEIKFNEFITMSTRITVQTELER